MRRGRKMRERRWKYFLCFSFEQINRTTPTIVAYFSSRLTSENWVLLMPEEALPASNDLKKCSRWFQTRTIYVDSEEKMENDSIHDKFAGKSSEYHFLKMFWYSGNVFTLPYFPDLSVNTTNWQLTDVSHVSCLKGCQSKCQSAVQICEKSRDNPIYIWCPKSDHDKIEILRWEKSRWRWRDFGQKKDR